VSNFEIQAVPYVPRSMAHPQGVKLCHAHLVSKGLPSMSGWLFVTLTVDRSQFDSPRQCYDEVRKKHLAYFKKQLRRAGFNKSRSMLQKLEFHADDEGWPHWHLVVKESRFIDFKLLNKWWTLGHTDIRRVKKSDREFDYLFKYVCKDGSLPSWLLNNYKRVRFIQTWGIFESQETPQSLDSDCEPRDEEVLREKIKKWSKKTTLWTRLTSGELVSVYTVDLLINFMLVHNHFVGRDDIKTYSDKIILPASDYLGAFVKTKIIDENDNT